VEFFCSHSVESERCKGHQGDLYGFGGTAPKWTCAKCASLPEKKCTVNDAWMPFCTNWDECKGRRNIRTGEGASYTWACFRCSEEREVREQELRKRELQGQELQEHELQELKLLDEEPFKWSDPETIHTNEASSNDCKGGVAGCPVKLSNFRIDCRLIPGKNKKYELSWTSPRTCDWHCKCGHMNSYKTFNCVKCEALYTTSKSLYLTWGPAAPDGSKDLAGI